MVAMKNINILLRTSYVDEYTIVEALKILGSERVVFGSDFPSNKPMYELEKVRRLRWVYPGLVKDEDLKMILGENVARVLNIKR